MTARYLIGDVFERMAELPDASVDLIMCSPPFLALRSYLPADHPDKGKEIGSEATPAAFVDTLLRLSSEWRRLLAPHGSICIELGDTYSGSVAFDGTDDFSISKGRGKMVMGGTGPMRSRNGHGWPLAKSLCLIPELYRIGLVYGLNPLTGQPSPAGRWRARNVVRWHRPNPPVGALGDKFRPATSDMVIACISGTRYFDLDAVREPSPSAEHHARYPQALYQNSGKPRNADRGDAGKYASSGLNPAGAPPLDTWTIPTEAYKGAHYATWPRDLCTRPILAMTPQHVCNECGQPRRRIVGEPTYVQTATGGKPAVMDFRDGTPIGNGVRSPKTTGGDSSVTRVAETLGWSDCGHNNWRRGLVLDPFAGTGTTLAVATGHGRDAIGIDLDARNLDLARERVGMFLEVESGAL